MWQAYKYIYYWIYIWQKKLWGEEDVPQFTAVIGMSLSFMANIASLIVIVEIFQNEHFVPDNIPPFYVILFASIIIIFHYFLFMHKGNFIKIENEFKNESNETRKRKRIWALLYVFGSPLFFVFLLFFGIWFNNNFR